MSFLFHDSLPFHDFYLIRHSIGVGGEKPKFIELIESSTKSIFFTDQAGCAFPKFSSCILCVCIQ